MIYSLQLQLRRASRTAERRVSAESSAGRRIVRFAKLRSHTHVFPPRAKTMRRPRLLVKLWVDAFLMYARMRRRARKRHPARPLKRRPFRTTVSLGMEKNIGRTSNNLSRWTSSTLARNLRDLLKCVDINSIVRIIPQQRLCRIMGIELIPRLDRLHINRSLYGFEISRYRWRRSFAKRETSARFRVTRARRANDLIN